MKCFVPSTRAEINVDTLVFIPKKIDFPKVTVDDFLKQSAVDIITLLTEPPSNMIPSIQAGDTTRAALLQLATLLHCSEVDQSKLEFTTESNKTIIPTPKPQTKPSPTPQLTPLQQTMHQLTRVLETKQKLSTSLSHQRSSFKHQAANFLVTSKACQWPMPQSLFHIYDHQDKRLTLSKALDQGHNLKLFHIYDEQGKILTLDKVLKGSQKDIWEKSASNEFGRLAQGNRFGVQYRDGMEFIHKKDVPQDRKITYASFVLDY